MSALMERPELRCGSCRTTPSEDPLVRSLAEEEGLTPDEYVWREEGTLNEETGLYACDSCYLKLGMPANPFPGPPWKFGDPI